MKKLLLAATALLAVNLDIHAQTPVWSTDVAPILYNKCAGCHRPGGIAPFSLLTYTDAFNYGGAMSAAVQAKYMPPWPPDPKYSRLAHERLLSDEEIATIKDWVDNGKNEGDPNLAPPAPTFNPNGELPGTPDFIAKIPTYTSTAQNGDLYRCFVIPSGQSATKYITAFEAIPGNREIVHHVLVYADTSGTCANLDAASPEPGYTSFGGVGTNDAILIGGWVPGTSPIQYPKGFGVPLPENADIVVQIHYPAGTNGMQDSTKINFFFSSGTVRPVRIDPVLNHFTALQNGPLMIPANQTKSFVEHYAGIPIDASILGVAPHMHLIGKSIKSYAVTSTGDTLKHINIPDWDFHWQGFYLFRKIQKVPANSELYAEAFYDNTSSNPFNPSNPPQDVHAGEATTDEMMIVYYIWTPYLPGDENIFIDSTSPVSTPQLKNYYEGQQLLGIYPNPAGNSIALKCHFDKAEKVRLTVTDMQGRTVVMKEENVAKGYSIKTIDLSNLPSGNYLLQMHTSEGIKTEKIAVQH